jgi:hypothetical protein
VRTLRARVEDAIERLVAMLDQLDGDADFEDNADLEPSIGGRVLVRDRNRARG